MAKVVDNRNNNPNHIEHIKEHYEKHLEGMIAKHGSVLQTMLSSFRKRNKSPNRLIKVYILKPE